MTFSDPRRFKKENIIKFIIKFIKCIKYFLYVYVKVVNSQQKINTMIVTDFRKKVKDTKPLSIILFSG